MNLTTDFIKKMIMSFILLNKINPKILKELSIKKIVFINKLTQNLNKFYNKIFWEGTSLIVNTMFILIWLMMPSNFLLDFGIFLDKEINMKNIKVPRKFYLSPLDLLKLSSD